MQTVVIVRSNGRISRKAHVSNCRACDGCAYFSDHAVKRPIDRKTDPTSATIERISPAPSFFSLWHLFCSQTDRSGYRGRIRVGGVLLEAAGHPGASAAVHAHQLHHRVSWGAGGAGFRWYGGRRRRRKGLGGRCAWPNERCYTCICYMDVYARAQPSLLMASLLRSLVTKALCVTLGMTLRAALRTASCMSFFGALAYLAYRVSQSQQYGRNKVTEQTDTGTYLFCEDNAHTQTAR